MVGSAVETIVESSAARSIASTSPLNTTRIWRWVSGAEPTGTGVDAAFILELDGVHSGATALARRLDHTPVGQDECWAAPFAFLLCQPIASCVEAHPIDSWDVQALLVSETRAELLPSCASG